MGSEQNNRLVCYTGITGVGKDYLLDKALQEQPEAERFRVLGMGQMMGEESRMDRDSIRGSLDLAQLGAVQQRVLERIKASTPAVLNTHVVFKQNGMLATNPDFERALRPAGYVMVTARPEQIAEWRRRRNESQERKSDEEPVERIAMHQEIAIETVRVIARGLNAQFLPVFNNPNETSVSAGMIRNFIETLLHE